jgi:hypothetical protein
MVCRRTKKKVDCLVYLLSCALWLAVTERKDASSHSRPVPCVTLILGTPHQHSLPTQHATFD